MSVFDNLKCTLKSRWFIIWFIMIFIILIIWSYTEMTGSVCFLLCVIYTIVQTITVFLINTHDCNTYNLRKLKPMCDELFNLEHKRENKFEEKKIE